MNLAGPLGGLGAALAVIGVSYAMGAAIVYFMLPETLAWDRDVEPPGPTLPEPPRPP